MFGAERPVEGMGRLGGESLRPTFAGFRWKAYCMIVPCRA
jgi:hypothetical protein